MGSRAELGISRFAGKWDFEVALGAWLYTKNSNFYGGSFRTQDPLGSIQAHVVRLLPHKTWLAGDGTFYMGGVRMVEIRFMPTFRGIPVWEGHSGSLLTAGRRCDSLTKGPSHGLVPILPQSPSRTR